MKSRTREGLVSVAKERMSAATDQISSTSIAKRNSSVGNNLLLARDRRNEVFPCTWDRVIHYLEVNMRHFKLESL